ncbi:MAG: histidine kinase, partial [Bacteroidota bacterium]
LMNVATALLLCCLFLLIPAVSAQFANKNKEAAIISQRIREGLPIDSASKVLDDWAQSIGPEYDYWVLGLRGKLLAREGALDSALIVLRQALEAAEADSNAYWAGSVASDLGVVYDWQDNEEEALNYFLIAQRYFVLAKDMEGVLRTKLNAVSIFGQKEQKDKVIEYLDEVLESISAIDNHELKAYAYFVASSHYVELGEQEVNFLEKGDSLGAIGVAIARAHHLHKRVGQFYLVLSAVRWLRGQPQSAIQYADSLRQYEPYLGAVAIWQSHLRKADAFASMDDYVQAFRYLDSATLVNASDFLQLIVWERKYDWNKQLARYPEALESLEMLRNLEQEMLNNEKDATIRTLESEYQTSAQAAEIDQLNQRQEITALRAKQRQIQLWSALVIVLLVSAVGAIAYQRALSRNRERMAIQKQQLLRSQINPHFIFNALSSIRGYLFANRDTSPVIDYLGKFARLMRNVLELSSQEWVSLEEELSSLELYLQIQQLRHKHKFDYDIQVDPCIEVRSVQVPPLSAQPFIENAIEHGLAEAKSRGKVQVTCTYVEEKIYFCIEDNGIGIAHAKQSTSHKSRAIALFKERLALLSRKMKASLTFKIEDLTDTEQREGTRISYFLPVKLLTS